MQRDTKLREDERNEALRQYQAQLNERLTEDIAAAKAHRAVSAQLNGEHSDNLQVLRLEETVGMYGAALQRRVGESTIAIENMLALGVQVWRDKLIGEWLSMSSISCCIRCCKQMQELLDTEQIWDILYQLHILPRCGAPVTSRETPCWKDLCRRRWVRSVVVDVDVAAPAVDTPDMCKWSHEYANTRTPVSNPSPVVHMACSHCLQVSVFDDRCS